MRFRRSSTVYRFLRETGVHTDHSAADVHAHGSRDHSTARRNDRTDSTALTAVRVGHQCHVGMHERHGRGLPRLRECLVVEMRCPIEQPRAHLCRGHEISLQPPPRGGAIGTVVARTESNPPAIAVARRCGPSDRYAASRLARSASSGRPATMPRSQAHRCRRAPGR